MNINILQNGINLLEKNVNKSKGKNVISSNIKNYIEFCSTLGLKQLIRVPRRTTSNTCRLALLKHLYLTINLFFAPEKSREQNLLNTIILNFTL